MISSRSSSGSSHSISYRPDIDGLRALAVLPVILFHANIPLFTGGFIGVDIFFVISGFLITSSLLKDLSEQRFSLAGFYERRGRRILPALTVVVIFCMIAGFFLLTPGSIKSFSNSAVWLSFFSSNLYFKREFGYFDAVANTKPLLHTWSLSVEEQFYLFFPILLSIGWKYVRKHLGAALLALSVASFALSCRGVTRDPSAAFYFIHYRAWELGIGGLLALAFHPAVGFGLPHLSQIVREFLGAIGIVLILAPVFFYTSITPFPGVAALPPCLGAFLIIWVNTGSSTYCGRLLSTRPLVGVGLMSYSLYLWHWPLLVFGKLYKGEDLSRWAGAGLLAVAFAASWISLRLVEIPFRRKVLLPRRNQVLLCSVVALISMGTIGKILPQRLSRRHSNVATAKVSEDARPVLPSSPNGKFWKVDDDISIYTIGDRSKTGVLVIGDSYAHHWINGLEKVADDNSITIHVQAMSSCLPLINTYIPDADRQYHQFGQKRNASFDRIIDQIHVKHVVLAGAWTSFIDPSFPLVPLYTLHVDDQYSKSMAEQRDLIRRQLKATIEFFNGRGCKVWVLLTAPEYPYNVPLKIATLARKGKPIEMSSLPRDAILTRRAITCTLLTEVVSHFKSSDAAILDPFELFCSQGNSITAKDGHSLYYDQGHLSYYGSLFGRGVFQPLVDEMNSAKLEEPEQQKAGSATLPAR